jgi:hypothetical protein
MRRESARYERARSRMPDEHDSLFHRDNESFPTSGLRVETSIGEIADEGSEVA